LFLCRYSYIEEKGYALSRCRIATQRISVKHTHYRRLPSPNTANKSRYCILSPDVIVKGLSFQGDVYQVVVFRFLTIMFAYPKFENDSVLLFRYRASHQCFRFPSKSEVNPEYRSRIKYGDDDEYYMIRLSGVEHKSGKWRTYCITRKK